MWLIDRCRLKEWVNYVECDVRDNLGKREACILATGSGHQRAQALGVIEGD